MAMEMIERGSSSNNEGVTLFSISGSSNPDWYLSSCCLINRFFNSVNVSAVVKPILSIPISLL